LTIDKGYEAEDANEALDAMQRAGVQSDAAYAEAFARYKWRNSRWAAWRVRGALRQKGVDDRDIDLGFGPVFAEGGAIKIDLFEDDEDDDEDDEENLERTRAKELLQAARTQFKRNKRGDFQARVRRLMAWLERRGHGGSVIRDIVTVLKREEEYSDDDEDDGALHFDG
jgi:SOS response regulatory protein OraA/RecX